MSAPVLAGPAHAADSATILSALDRVVDPELDESLVRLGFVDGVSIEGASVTLVLRLPTYWCSPNFAYLMASDARQRVLELPGVERVDVILKDHAHAGVISAGASAGRPFADVFPGEAGGDLEELRARFQSKAFGMRQEQLVRFLLEDGLTPEQIVGLRVGDVECPRELVLRVGEQCRPLPGGAALARAYLEKRQQVGLAGDAGAALVTDELGSAIAADDLLGYLRRARRQRVSMVMQTALCRGLLETRYGDSAAERVHGSPAHTRVTNPRKEAEKS